MSPSGLSWAGPIPAAGGIRLRSITSTTRPILLTLALVALALPVGAEHCETYSTSEPEVSAGGIYVDNDLCQMCMFSIWIYQESNGIEGLQRGDEVVDDTCHGSIPHDTIIF